MKEFKDFAVKGHIVDMAVGIVIGVAFGNIITVFVSGVIMPPIGVLSAGVDFSNLEIIVKEAVGETPAVLISYGLFIQTLIDFTIIAFVIFMVVKGSNKLKGAEDPGGEEKMPEESIAPSPEAVLPTEIRDLLKSK